MNTYIRIVAIGSLVWSGYAMGQSKGPIPSWVLKSDPKPSHNSEESVIYISDDTQINVDTQEKYYFYDFQLNSSSAIDEYGDIKIEFEPELEEIILHRVQIIRENEVLDQTNPKQIRVMDMESEQSEKVYSGTKQLLINTRGLKVGDRIRYDYTLREKHRLFGPNQFGRAFTKATENIDNWRLRIVSSKPVFSKIVGPDIPLDHSKANEWIWTTSDLPAQKFDRRNPLNGLPHIQYSTFTSWTEFKDIINPYYSLKSLPKELDAQIAEWRKLPNDREKMKAAATFVQDGIRYVSLSIGPHSWIPHDPKVTFQNSFGDCKDKAYFLVHILKALGIEANVALVHSSEGDAVNTILPSVGAFNHAIVATMLDGKRQWIDATISLERGRFFDYPPDYGYALVLDPSKNELESMDHKAGLPNFINEEDFYLADDGTAKADIVNHYRGPSATRIVRERDSNAKYEDEILNKYKKLYRDAAFSKKVEWSYEADGSVIMKASLNLKNYFTQDKLSVHQEMFNRLPISIDDIDETLPMLIPKYENVRSRIRVHRASGMPKYKDFHKVFDLPFLYATRDFVRIDEETQSFELSFQFKKSRILPAEMERYREVQNFFEEESTYSITQKELPKSRESSRLIMLGLIAASIFGTFAARMRHRSPGRPPSSPKKASKVDLGDTPFDPLYFKDEAALQDYVARCSCGKCGEKTFESANEGHVQMDGKMIFYCDLLCKCGNKDVLYFDKKAVGVA